MEKVFTPSVSEQAATLLADEKREARVLEAKYILGELARADKHAALLRARLVELDNGAEPRLTDHNGDKLFRRDHLNG